MNQGMKQRLAGVLIVGCLAIILLPMLLDGDGLESPEFRIDVPAAPPAIRSSLPAPTAPVRNEAPPPGPLQSPPETRGDAIARPEPAASDEPQGQAQPAPAEAPIASAPEEAASQPGYSPEGLLEGWTVRLASFGDPDNAHALVRRLLADEQRAYTRERRTGNGRFTAVYVGPVLTREEAGQLQQRLSTRYQLDGLVERFSIAD